MSASTPAPLPKKKKIASMVISNIGTALIRQFVCIKTDICE